jgi:hypothetical protein
VRVPWLTRVNAVKKGRDVPGLTSQSSRIGQTACPAAARDVLAGPRRLTRDEDCQGGSCATSSVPMSATASFTSAGPGQRRSDPVPVPAPPVPRADWGLSLAVAGPRRSRQPAREREVLECGGAWLVSWVAAGAGPASLPVLARGPTPQGPAATQAGKSTAPLMVQHEGTRLKSVPAQSERDRPGARDCGQTVTAWRAASCHGGTAGHSRAFGRAHAEE